MVGGGWGMRVWRAKAHWTTAVFVLTPWFQLSVSVVPRQTVATTFWPQWSKYNQRGTRWY